MHKWLLGRGDPMIVSLADINFENQSAVLINVGNREIFPLVGYKSPASFPAVP